MNKRYKVDMFSTEVIRGKAFAAEQKLRELKKRISKLKAIGKQFVQKNKSVANNYKICGKHEQFINSKI